ncbi:MAG: putative inorganic carbon transporter subunit DabA, partial [Myxococcaceae bacterium]
MKFNNSKNIFQMTPKTHVIDAIKVAIKRIPPLWPLSRFVAVNPFVGLSGLDFRTAAMLLKKVSGASMAMSPAFYRERYEGSLISQQDLEESLKEVSDLKVTVEELLKA